MLRRSIMASVPALALLRPGRVAAQQGAGLATVQSRHGVAATLDRFEAAVREKGWVVFTRIDHAAAAREAGLPLRPRTVVIFGNPRAGTPAMAAHPTLALDLPMRVLVWEDEQGGVWLTRNTGDHTAEAIYRRHGAAMPAEARQALEALLSGLVRQATE